MKLTQRYIIRLDDACPTMKRYQWDRFEKLFDHYRIKPIVAVIPNNQSEEYIIDKEDPLFWDTVRKWQDKKWHIALHGYNHVYIPKSRGAIIPFNSNSEFAGLSFQRQRKKIKMGLEKFEQESIRTSLWVAPAHSFDKNTLKVLKETHKIDTISDGFSLYPFSAYGFTWLPQQLWKPIYYNFGIWTICFHPNTLKDNNFVLLENFLSHRSCEFITDLERVKNRYKSRKKNLLDWIYWYQFLLRRRASSYLGNRLNRELRR